MSRAGQAAGAGMLAFGSLMSITAALPPVGPVACVVGTSMAGLGAYIMVLFTPEAGKVPP